ncbi:ATP synthase mitochondrial F1 complex assembly factor 2 [Umbelopsis nana]
MKRFWKKASVNLVDGKYTVTLDGRNLRTPSKNKIQLPPNRKQLAQLLAAEWDGQTSNLKPHSLPLTSLLSRAIDGLDLEMTEDPSVRPQVIDKLMSYLDTDTICFHEDFPEALVKLQDQHWKPILQWIEKQYDVELKVTDGIFRVEQPQKTKDTLRKVVNEMDALELAAFERAVISSKSFLIGLALVKRGINIEQAAQAAHVEVNSQIDRWGEVEDSHDVEKEYIRQALGSVACVVMHNPKP